MAPVDWMQKNLSVIGKRSLRDICLVGSHDAGMSVLNGHTFFGTPSVTVTQTLPIKEQLEVGVRVFDVRPVIANGGKYLCGHYSEFNLGEFPAAIRNTMRLIPNLPNKIATWQGGNGEYLQAIVDGVNDFCNKNAELVILDMRRWNGFNTDGENSDYKWFTPEEWNGVLKILQGLQHRFTPPTIETHDTTKTPPTSSPIDFTLSPVQDFIGKGEAAVVCIMKDDVDCGGLLGKGFFKTSHFNFPTDSQRWLSEELPWYNLIENVLQDFGISALGSIPIPRIQLNNIGHNIVNPITAGPLASANLLNPAMGISNALWTPSPPYVPILPFPIPLPGTSPISVSSILDPNNPGPVGGASLTSIVMKARMKNNTELPKIAGTARSSKTAPCIIWIDAAESPSLSEMCQQINIDIARKDSKL